MDESTVKSYISCYDFNGLLQHFEVPREVAIYIRQLESYIKQPALSRLKEVYSFRF